MQSEGKSAMANKKYWIGIFITMALNVIMLQWTIEAYFGQEHEHVWTYSSIAFVSSIICFVIYLRWRKQEYTK